MHLILTGATGLVGSGVLDAMTKMKDVTKISVLSRRPVKMAEDAKDPRINVIIHKDFTKYDKELLDKLRGASGVVWALGISQTAVDKEEYVKITKDYALAAAHAFQSLPEPDQQKPFNFIYVSGLGATFTPTFYSPTFARVKGETELQLAALRKSNPVFHAHTVRPAMIDPLQHPDILPYLPPSTPAIGTFSSTVSRFVGRWVKSMHSPTEPLGTFFAEMAMGRFDKQMEEEVGTSGKGNGIERLDGGFMVLENSAIRRLGGMD